MQALAKSGMRLGPGLEDDSKKQTLTPLKIGGRDTDDTIMVPEEVAREMERLAQEVRCWCRLSKGAPSRVWWSLNLQCFLCFAFLCEVDMTMSIKMCRVSCLCNVGVCSSNRLS